jgi:hypothetical protein
MGASPRLSRGFHRLALFLAAIPFLLGGAWSIIVAEGEADSARSQNMPETFSYAAHFLPPLGLGLAITLGVSLAVYGIVRAIGWVIGGFAS